MARQDLCVSNPANLFSSLPARVSLRLPEWCREIKPLLGTITSLWDTYLHHDLISGFGWVSGSAPEKGPGSSLGRAAAKSHFRECWQQHAPAKGKTAHPESHQCHDTYQQQGAQGRKEKKKETERKGEKWLMVMKSINRGN